MGELKKKLAECVQALAKAREDKAIAPERRKEFREAKLDMPGSHDHLANQVTSAKGVSERGIEARRGDSKVPGAIAHGFGRVTEPSKHMESAKKLFRAIKNMQAKVPKMNLPKSEDMSKAITPKEVSEPIIANPTKISERMIINSPTYFNQNGDSTVRLKKILKKCKGV